MYDTGIADRLRAAGLKVVEVDGWKTRGRTSTPSFDPKGYVHHHTAGASSGNAPSLGICINGRSDLPGPLCNVFQARDNTIYVVAAGKANHAGPGSWKGLSGNSTVYGNEVENVGTAAEPWRADQHETAARVAVALLGPKGNSDLCCEHKEWNPGGKFDAHTIDGNFFRSLVFHYMHFEPDPAPVQDMEDEMFAIVVPPDKKMVPVPLPTPGTTVKGCWVSIQSDAAGAKLRLAWRLRGGWVVHEDVQIDNGFRKSYNEQRKPAPIGSDVGALCVVNSGPEAVTVLVEPIR